MSVKILGGSARGFSLMTPKQVSTRPTSVMIRRKLFDWRQNLDDYVFIDICAGSGAMGFEALSRGANKIILNDQMKGAYQTLKHNQEALLKSFDFAADAISVQNLEALQWIKRELGYLGNLGDSVILYFDPPYENHKLYQDVLEELKKQQFQGEVWVESDHLKGVSPDEVSGLFSSVTKIVEHGDHFVLVGKLV